MNIFFIRKSEFSKSLDKSSFENKYKNQKRDCEYTLGHFLVKFIAKKFYSVNNPKISDSTKKPTLENSNLSFSISHSKDLVTVYFEESSNVGFDIEFMNPKRNIQKVAQYLKLPKTISNKEFYQYWTSYEAEYKSKK